MWAILCPVELGISSARDSIGSILSSEHLRRDTEAHGLVTSDLTFPDFSFHNLFSGFQQ